MSVVACPECGGRVRADPAAAWQPCPHCRAAFRPDDAAPLAGPAGDGTRADAPIVFEEIPEDPPEAKKRKQKRAEPMSAAVEPAARPAAKTRPAARAPRRATAKRPAAPAIPTGTLRPPRRPPPRLAAAPPGAADDDIWESEPPTPARGSRRRRKTRRRGRRRDGADVGFWLALLVTAAVVGVDLYVAWLDVTSGEGVSIPDIGRWLLTAFLLLKIWEGRNWARVTFVVLMFAGVGFAYLIRERLDRLVRQAGGRLSLEDRREVWDVMATLEYVAVVLLAAGVLLCTPWVGAFLARRRGDL